VKFRTSEIAEFVNGTLNGPDTEIAGASVDSRRVRKGQLFVPIVAERDGHAFIERAMAAGAGAYLTEQDPMGGSAVLVTNTREALWNLGAGARRRLGDLIIGVTGSVGKTTVKDLVAAGLATTFRTHANRGSFNNELGVPLSLLDAPDDTEAAIFEMGARFPGDIALLCELVQPKMGIITSIGSAHLSGLGGIAGVAREKGALVECLPSNGVAVLNDLECGDDIRRRSRAPILTFGTDSGDVRVRVLSEDAALRSSIRLQTPWGVEETTLQVRGRHQALNAAAAVTACVAAGAELSEALERISEETGSPHRMDVWTNSKGTTIINDAYNANPTSVAAALKSLSSLDADRRVAVLGVMAELGDASRLAHRDVGELARTLGIEIIGVGTRDYGGLFVADSNAAFEIIKDLGNHDAVLIKGSRVAGLEVIANKLNPSSREHA
jgi:UDP-N-acetylmuramoyl-tripeptide--D-alanyl-D-alanine ligase